MRRHSMPSRRERITRLKRWCRANGMDPSAMMLMPPSVWHAITDRAEPGDPTLGLGPRR